MIVDNIRIISESLGAFEEQYKLAKDLSNAVIDMVKNNTNNIRYQTENKTIKIANIHIEYNELPIFNANIDRVNSTEDSININVLIPYSHIMIDRDKLIGELTNVITHELMHWNVYLKRLKNNINNVIDTPNYYSSLIKIIRNTEPSSIAHQFAYALYATYYQEVNAIVSQTNVQICNIIGHGKKTNDDIKFALPQTESFQIYDNIINNVIPMINNLNNDDIQENIIDIFNYYDINFSIDDVRNHNKEILNISKIAIKKIIKNAILDNIL